MSRMNESCHVWMSHVTYEWVMSHIESRCPLHWPCTLSMGAPKTKCEEARWIGWQDFALCCCVLLCAAVCCSMLQCVAVCCSGGQILDSNLLPRRHLRWVCACVGVFACARVCVWERERERVCVCVCVCVCECACVCLFVYVCAGARVHPPARAWERVLPYARALEREYCPMVQGRMDKALYTGCVCKRTLTSSTPIWRKDAYVNNEAVVGRVCWACYSVLHCVVMCMRVLQRAAVPRFDLGRVGWF